MIDHQNAEYAVGLAADLARAENGTTATINSRMSDGSTPGLQPSLRDIPFSCTHTALRFTGLILTHFRFGVGFQASSPLAPAPIAGPARHPPTSR